MDYASDIEQNILAFNVINDRLGDIRDEMLHLNNMPFAYKFYQSQGHWTRTPGNNELLRVERMIGSIQSFIRDTVRTLIQQKKEALAY